MMTYINSVNTDCALPTVHGWAIPHIVVGAATERTLVWTTKHCDVFVFSLG